MQQTLFEEKLFTLGSQYRIINELLSLKYRHFLTQRSQH